MTFVRLIHVRIDDEAARVFAQTGPNIPLEAAVQLLIDDYVNGVIAGRDDRLTDVVREEADDAGA